MKPVVNGLALITFSVLLNGSALAGDITVGQKDKAFVKNGKSVSKIVVKVGDTIHFKNEDPFFHNVFSLSDLKTFDLGSYPAGQSKPVTYDKAGEADVECAIHPQMRLKVVVQ